MADLKVSWVLISPDGRQVEKLAGKPSRIEEGLSLRCEEIVHSRLGYGNFHFERNGVTGTANMHDQFTYFSYEIVVEGGSLQDIEIVRQKIKEAIHVTVATA